MFHRHQHRAAPLSTNTESLREAQDGQTPGGPRTNLRVSGQHTD